MSSELCWRQHSRLRRSHTPTSYRNRSQIFEQKRDSSQSINVVVLLPLREIDHRKLRRLGLADNSYDEIGAYHLSEALKETSFQICLDLSHNQIGDAGAS